MTATLTSPQRPSLAAPMAVGCCLAAGTAYVVADDPSDGGFLPCPFRTLTGLWCPGCGVTRATHHLFRGDIVQALRFNAFVVVILASLAAVWLGWTLHAAGRSVRWAARIPVWAQVAAGAVLFAFAVVRNVPGIDGLRG
ncbi:MAG: DUF2752 domain-containing protein [Ilumatobacter sp.]|uniref:DUF2752 domain-containing protein n=1 Tax=Ilumatobacter sp. TaxID=1967498 RepID=UPI00261F464C|nr:DUF2752 domain-containing protein [Ilumatobacter sp.]MDJ0769113.1 DUF2752 domain-containing protein [Ilumatobacter sp.]